MTLREVDPLNHHVDSAVSSLVLGPDGRSVLWVADSIVTYRSADGRLRSTGRGIAEAWFTAR